MATVIDALVVTLGLDVSNFTAGKAKAEAGLKDYRASVRQIEDEIVEIRYRSTKETRKQDEQQIKDLQYRAHHEKRAAEDEDKRIKNSTAARKKQAEAISGVTKQVLGLAAVVVGVGGLEKFISSTVKGYTAISIAAAQAGLSTQQFAAYQNMIARNGGDAGTAGQAIASLGGSLEQWRALGQLDQGHRRAFSAIGVGRNDNALDVTAKFAEWAGHQKDKQYVSMIGQMAGLNPDMIDKAIQGGAAHKAGMAESVKLGVLDDAGARRLRNMNEEFMRLRQTLSGDSQNMLSASSSWIGATLHGVTGIAQANPALTSVALVLGTIATIVGGIVTTIGPLLRLLPSGAAVAGEVAAVSEGAAVVGGALAAPFIGAAVAAGAWAIPTGLNRAEGNAGARYNEAARIKKILMETGHWTDAEASGIVAGIGAESQFNPYAHGPADPKTGHRAYGLGQHLSADRLANFKRLFGHDISNATDNEQVRFIDWELMNSEAGAGRHIKGSKSADAAMMAYLRYGQRPGNDLAADIGRGRKYTAMAAGIHVGTMNVTLPNAKDAAAMKRDLPKVFASNPNVNQANSGLQ